MEYIESFFENISNIFYKKQNNDILLNINENTKIDENEINKLIEEVKYEIKLENDYKILENRYKILIQNNIEEDIKCVENNDEDKNDDDDNNDGMIPILI